MTDETPSPLSIRDDDEQFTPVRPFNSRDLIGCRACKRSNPPNRVNCIYCGVTLPDEELKTKLQRPSPRKLSESETGRSIIVTGRKDVELCPETLSGVSELLSLSPSIVTSIVYSGYSVPIARVSQEIEATLTLDRLKSLGIEANAVSDDDLGLSRMPPRRAPKLKFTESGATATLAGSTEQVEFPWSTVRLIVSGRLLESRVEVEERKKGTNDSEITNSSETSADELVFDLFATDSAQAIRVSAGSFDFSCLGSQMDLITSRNFGILLEMILKQAPNCVVDDSFSRVRKILDTVWPIEQRHHSSGIKRLSPGRYRTEAVLLRSNEMQFTRYSYLMNYLSTRGST
jgi:hypothetical protein